MPSLKEIKSRLSAVNSTRKITSAMQMVSSAKLRRAQSVITGMLPYQEKMNRMLTNLLGTDCKVESPYAVARLVKKAAIVAFSSNSSLCGTFNANISKSLAALIKDYEARGISRENLTVYPVGKKIEDYVDKSKLVKGGTYQAIAETPSYGEASILAETLMDQFNSGKIDEVKIIYHHFKSRGVQELLTVTFLPFDLSGEIDSLKDKGKLTGFNKYIVEPSAGEVVDALLPKVICLDLFTALADSNASEHAARMMAMQLATDNADEILDDLTVAYNKSRQQAITSEILDIVRGSMK